LTLTFFFPYVERVANGGIENDIGDVDPRCPNQGQRPLPDIQSGWRMYFVNDSCLRTN